MKIISHPEFLRQREEALFEKERSLDIEKYNLEISLMLIRERERSIRDKIKAMTLISATTFLVGLALGILIH
tara:strand:- start:635 stop:850 length:216 start_codon:yes stop_codon:yes gene_type:complete